MNYKLHYKQSKTLRSDIVKSKHTAQTLKWYLGKEVYVKFPKAHGEPDDFLCIKETKLTGGLLGRVDKEFKCDGFIYPILKTAEDLTDSDRYFVYEVYEFSHRGEKFNDFLYRMEFNIDKRNLRLFSRFIEKGYGAIPNKESTTGYVDLFGMPCYTPKMVEERHCEKG